MLKIRLLQLAQSVTLSNTFYHLSFSMPYSVGVCPTVCGGGAWHIVVKQKVVFRM